MKKVLYFSHYLERIRVFRSFEEEPDLEQLFIGPHPKTFNGVAEDYMDFGIKNIKTYADNKEAQRMVNEFCPDIVVQADMDKSIQLPASAKKVFVMHGVVGNHVRGYFGPSTSWDGFDLYCGATKNFKDIVDYFTSTVDKKKVLLNALPQIDFFNTNNYKTSNREDILGRTKNPGAKKIILFCGFSGKYRPDYYDHNEDYYRTLFELARISEKNNWLSMVKSRQGLRQTGKFLALDEPWIKSCVKPYADAQKNKFVHFIHPDSNIYDHFFADIVICNGCSSVEIEACVVNKPLIVVRTKVGPDKYDPLNTVNSGAAVLVDNISKLEDTIINSLDGDLHVNKQNALIESIGISVDGLAHKRITDAIKLL